MLGLHNILLIAPPPSSQQGQPPSNLNSQAYNPLGLGDSDLWGLKRSTQEKKDGGVLNGEEDDGCFKVCKDCGNRAKKECEYSRCRTCCKSRKYDCATHVKSTWVPAAHRRKIGDSGGGSSGSSSCGGKRPRVMSTPNVASASRSLGFEAASTHQDSSFKESLPGSVEAPAVFRCLRVTAIGDGEKEVAYQATVSISGHVFKGFLYNQGVAEKNSYPCIGRIMQLESTSSGRERDSSSPPVVNLADAFAASGN